MPDTTGTFDAVKGHNADLLRKMQEMAIYLAPYPTAPSITTITDASGANLSFPDVYKSVGMTSKDDGASWTPNLEIVETGAYGYGQPVRYDPKARPETLAFTMLESKRAVFELYYGIDLSGVTAAAGTKNEIGWATPNRPNNRNWRVIAIGREGQGADSIYHAEFLPKVTLTGVEAQTWGEDDPLTYGVTLAPQIDSALGYAHYTYWGGPGLTTALLTKMGFTKAGA